ncbi:MAG: DUF4197 domain-containing protein [Gammaproteobacteria bacterium]|nr:DUF4197 domain-containing protein [Gammaproteobacteria bacterium]
MPPSTPSLLPLLLVGLLLSAPIHAGWQDLLDSAIKEVDQYQSQQGGGKQSLLPPETIIKGLKDALAQGTEQAVSTLGTTDGFLKDETVRITLPEKLESVTKVLDKLGQKQLVTEFEETINRAAEKAVPQTAAILGESIQKMSIQDAQGILNGGDSAATDYFKRSSSGSLSDALLPIIQEATAGAGVTSLYKTLLSKVGFAANYIDMDQLDLDKYVTRQTLSGLFTKIAVEERLIRQDPAARGTAILQDVFGSLTKKP